MSTTRTSLTRLKIHKTSEFLGGFVLSKREAADTWTRTMICPLGEGGSILLSYVSESQNLEKETWNSTLRFGIFGCSIAFLLDIRISKEIQGCGFSGIREVIVRGITHSWSRCSCAVNLTMCFGALAWHCLFA
jgi:hypothetical protein